MAEPHKAGKDRDMGNTDILHVSARDNAVRHLRAGMNVNLHGLPGSGRSFLASAIAAEMDDAGWHVLTVHGIRALRDRPLEALALTGIISRQNSPGGPSTAVSAAVQGILGAVKAGSTLMVVDRSDDLDPMSVGAILGAYSQHPFPLLTITRPQPRTQHDPSGLASALRPGITIPVTPLSYVDTQTLIVGTLGGPVDAATVGRIFSATGGLPSLTITIINSARHSGLLARGTDAWEATADLWTPELSRMVEPLLDPLSPAAIDALHVLSMTGTVEVTTARRLVNWAALEELDGYNLLRFVPRGSDILVGVFPLAITEYFRRAGIGAQHLRVNETVEAVLGEDDAQQVMASLNVDTSASTADAGLMPQPGVSYSDGRDSDILLNRLLLEHWHREILLRHSEWENTPLPRTAAALLRTYLITGTHTHTAHTVRENTPRTGDPRELAAFDVWYALYVGLVERDNKAAQNILEQGSAQDSSWKAIGQAFSNFLTFTLDHVPPPDSIPINTATADTDPDTYEITRTCRAELLLTRGDSPRASQLIEEMGVTFSPFSMSRASLQAWAMVQQGQLDEGLAKALALMDVARSSMDVENLISAAYVAATAYVIRGRSADLRMLLGSALSSPVIPATARPAHVALLSIAANLAVDEGRTATAQTLAQQALALRVGPGPLPFGSPTLALARIDGARMSSAQARTLVSQRLWDEYADLSDKGYLLSGYLCGVIALTSEVTAERGQELLQLGSRIAAPIITPFQQLIDALVTGDGERLAVVGHELSQAGNVWGATQAYTSALWTLRAAGASARAAEIHADAKRRLEAWGIGAASGLRTASEEAELTAREDEIARLAASGMSNQEIARRLLISVRTVENHLHRVFRKLGVENRTEMSRALLR